MPDVGKDLWEWTEGKEGSEERDWRGGNRRKQPRSLIQCGGDIGDGNGNPEAQLSGRKELGAQGSIQINSAPEGYWLPRGKGPEGGVKAGEGRPQDVGPTGKLLSRFTFVSCAPHSLNSCQSEFCQVRGTRKVFWDLSVSFLPQALLMTSG